MANSDDLIKQIQRLPLHQQQHIYSFLQEVLVLGSQVSQITQEVKHRKLKNLDLPREKSALIVVLKLYQETENIMVNKDISVSHVEKPLLTLLTLLLTRARKH